MDHITMELTDDQVTDIVVKELANIVEDNYVKEDVRYAAIRIIQYYLRPDQYQQFISNRIHEEFKNIQYPA